MLPFFSQLDSGQEATVRTGHGTTDSLASFTAALRQVSDNLKRYCKFEDKVPDEIWMEVHDILQETGIKTIPKKKKCKKAKWLSEEAL